MKFIYLALIGLITSEQVQAIRTQGDGVWDDMLEATDKSSYVSDTPKDYTEKPKPKVDYKKLEQEQKAQQALAEKEEGERKQIE